MVPLRKQAADQAVQKKAQRESDFRFLCPATCCAVAQPAPLLGRLWPWLTVSTLHPTQPLNPVFARWGKLPAGMRTEACLPWPGPFLQLLWGQGTGYADRAWMGVT